MGPRRGRQDTGQTLGEAPAAGFPHTMLALNLGWPEELDAVFGEIRTAAAASSMRRPGRTGACIPAPYLQGALEPLPSRLVVPPVQVDRGEAVPGIRGFLQH